MKIGIITFHSVTNYGAALQAYALKQALQQTGNDVEIINYSPLKITAPYKPLCFYNYKNLNFFKKIRRILSEIYHFPSVNKKNVGFKNFFKKYYSLSGKEIKTVEKLKSLNLDYDVCFAGSDQVWNPDITKGFDEAYFLNFGSNKMVRATYAASIGKDKLSSEEQVKFQNLLENIDYISMREAVATDYVNSVTSKNAVTVLDPTFLLTKNDWTKLFDLTPLVKQKYVFVYTLYPNEELTKLVENLSAVKNLPVVTLNTTKVYTNELKRFPFADPTIFVNLIANAEYVVTNSFHGTAFSVNFSKKFYTLLGKRTSRVTNLLSIVGLNDRAFTKYSDDLINLNEIDWTSVGDKLNVERDNSLKYIDEVLSDGRIND